MPPKKDAPKPVDHFPEVMIFLLVLVLLGMAATRLDYSNYSTLWDRFLAYFFAHIWPVLKILAVIISVLSFLWLCVAARKLYLLGKEEEAYYHAADPTDNANLEVEPKDHKQWLQVQAHMSSTNLAEWRLAIIEADVILEEALRAANYHGDTIGDMLKSVAPGDFVSVNEAWEAHKVRNRIAHDGANYQLNEREARIVISMYEKVFKEFELI